MKKKLLLIFAVSISLTNFISAHTGKGYDSYQNMMGNYGILDWIFMILIIIALVLLIIWLTKRIINLNNKKGTKK